MKTLIALLFLLNLSIGAHRPIKEPFYEWKPCNCPDEDQVIGLSTQHFILNRMWTESLKHELEQCQNPKALN